MHVANWQQCTDVPIERFPYKGKQYIVSGTSVRWLSKHGDDGTGWPEYGLRFFTIQPEGEIPIHNHFYLQTMYILEGTCECYQYDPDTEEVIGSYLAAPGDFIYIPSMEPHGMRNIGKKPLTFLCCICNIYENEDS